MAQPSSVNKEAKGNVSLVDFQNNEQWHLHGASDDRTFLQLKQVDLNLFISTRCYACQLLGQHNTLESSLSQTSLSF